MLSIDGAPVVPHERYHNEEPILIGLGFRLAVEAISICAVLSPHHVIGEFNPPTHPMRIAHQ
jgi:hypothetical protein